MWLCEMLNRYGVAKEKLTNTGAHSLKATALSWLAKAGVEERIRRVLGYHVKPKDSSVALYSRHALAGSLERLVEIELHQEWLLQAKRLAFRKVD